MKAAANKAHQPTLPTLLNAVSPAADRARPVFTPKQQQLVPVTQHPSAHAAATAVRMQSCSTSTNQNNVHVDKVDVHAELEAAIDAVRAASTLCKVRGVLSALGTLFACIVSHPQLCHQQHVQIQLSQAEQANKDDDSPVTVADYGMVFCLA